MEGNGIGQDRTEGNGMEHHKPQSFGPIEICEHRWLELSERYMYCKKCDMAFDSETGQYFKPGQIEFFKTIILPFCWVYDSCRQFVYWFKKKILKRKVPN